jgi:hypothetical protein
VQVGFNISLRYILKMRQILTYGLCIISFCSYGQPDRLLPVRDYFNHYEHERDYYPHVFNHLINGLSLTPIARVVVLPSFSAEHVISIEKSDNKKDFSLIYKKCKESIWYSEKRDKIKTEIHEIPIDSSFAILVGKVFIKATTEIKYPTEPQWGLDGITYIMSTFVPKYGIQTGETWSPRTGTRMRQLVDISDILISMTTANKADRDKFKNEIQDIGTDFLNE